MIETGRYLVTEIMFDDGRSYEIDVPTLFMNNEVMTKLYLRSRLFDMKTVKFKYAKVNGWYTINNPVQMYSSEFMFTITEPDDSVPIKVFPMIKTSTIVTITDQDPLDEDIEYVIFDHLRFELEVDFYYERLS